MMVPLNITTSQPDYTQTKRKRRFRRIWQQYQHLGDKTAFKSRKPHYISELTRVSKIFLENISIQRKADMSVWKAIKTAKKPQQQLHPLKFACSWAITVIEKAEALIDHLDYAYRLNNIIMYL